MRHTLTAVFNDRGKAQQALAELLARGYPPADAMLTKVPGAGASSSDGPPVPAWRERPGASSARLLARLAGFPESRRTVTAAQPRAADSHVLTLSTDSAHEADRAAALITGLIPGADIRKTALAAGHWPGKPRPDDRGSKVHAALAAYRFGHDLHESERYRNRSWHESTADLKVLWEAHGPHQPDWDGSEAAVRLGWDSTSPEIDDDSHYRNHWRTRHPASATRPGAAHYPGPAVPGPAAKDTPACRHPGEAGSWGNFMDAVRHGWSRTRIGDNVDEAIYRLHHASTYPGTNYDDLAPVYRYGRQLRRRTMFAGQGWIEAEGALRAEWERHHLGAKPLSWDEVKAALHAGWDLEGPGRPA